MKKLKGFSLIEMLITIVIMQLLVGKRNLGRREVNENQLQGNLGG